MRLGRDFYRRDANEVAVDLLGKILVHENEEGVVKGEIIEVEAYKGEGDDACHANDRLRTKRTEVMFLDGGHAYVYLIYGVYYCFNIVTNHIDVPEAVLIRAIRPVEGIEIMKNRRGIEDRKRLTNGPGKLSIAMGIDKSLNAKDMCEGSFYVEEPTSIADFEIERTKRININYAVNSKDFLWRYVIKNC